MPRILMLTTLLAVALAGSWYYWRGLPRPFVKVVTLAGSGVRIGPQSELSDPFGVAADGNEIFVTDGLAGRLYRVSLNGRVDLVTDQLNMPSQLAIAPDGSIIVANTGAHTVVRVDRRSGIVKLIAGAPDQSGSVDGKATEARFNGPIGVAVTPHGDIYIADTYNDRIRHVTPDGDVTTLAGERSGNADGTGAEARFDTPCGLALLANSDLIVADTANHALRRLTMAGAVTTLALVGENASFRLGSPMAILASGANEFYVADSDGGVYFVHFGTEPAVRPPFEKDVSPSRYLDAVLYRVAGGNGPGLLDGEIGTARFNRPMSIALAGSNRLLVADSGNGLVRAIVPGTAEVGYPADPAISTIGASTIRKAVQPRWPFDPPNARREIAGTFGEVRGQAGDGHDAWFHNGLDVPGAYGEPVRALYSERVVLPIAVEAAAGLRERLRLPLLGYIHVKFGRDQNDRPTGLRGVLLEHDETGKVTGVRIPRGTKVEAGEILGTLNQFNHVHLIAGPSGAEINALAALEFPGLVDTVSPTIEVIRLLTDSGEIPVEKGKAPVLTGSIRIVVRAYDQVEGNRTDRRLGVYQIGYQILASNGSSLPSQPEPVFNLRFERLPEDQGAVPLVFAEPSQSGYTGRTLFDYIVTNHVRDGKARTGKLETGELANGEYILRAIAEDYFRNRTTKDLRIIIAN